MAIVTVTHKKFLAGLKYKQRKDNNKMGQLKKLKGLIDSFERLPDGNFKESVRIDMEQMKELFSEIHSLRELKDKLFLDELEDKDVNTYKNE